MAKSGRSIFQLPDNYKSGEDESYRAMFSSWLVSRNELRGDELGVWEPAWETNCWMFQTLDAETAYPVR